MLIHSPVCKPLLRIGCIVHFWAGASRYQPSSSAAGSSAAPSAASGYSDPFTGSYMTRCWRVVGGLISSSRRRSVSTRSFALLGESHSTGSVQRSVHRRFAICTAGNHGNPTTTSTKDENSPSRKPSSLLDCNLETELFRPEEVDLAFQTMQCSCYAHQTLTAKRRHQERGGTSHTT